MNGQEQSTLDNIDKILSRHIEVSEERWNRIEPIVKAYHDQKIVDVFLRKIWRGVVGLLGVLALIGGIWALFFND